MNDPDLTILRIFQVSTTINCRHSNAITHTQVKDADDDGSKKKILGERKEYSSGSRGCTRKTRMMMMMMMTVMMMMLIGDAERKERSSVCSK